MGEEMNIRLWLAKKIDKEEEYPQLWYHMPRKKNYPRLRRVLQWLCGLMGHEWSLTEWGYSGSEYADRWCRWCDTMVSVPKTSIRFQFPGAKDMMAILDKGESI